eukprot:1845622-Amphidinium_carterae.1
MPYFGARSFAFQTKVVLSGETRLSTAQLNTHCNCHGKVQEGFFPLPIDYRVESFSSWWTATEGLA